MTELEPTSAGWPVPEPAAPSWPTLRARWDLGRDRNPYWVYLARLSGADSRRSMARCLDRIAAMIHPLPADVPPCPSGYGEEVRWWDLRYVHVTALRTKLAEAGWSPSHVNKHLSALRGVLEQSWKLGFMSAEDYQRARDVKNVKGSREPAGRNIHTDEITALLTVCLGDKNTALGVRDAALVAVLQSTGIRRAEAASALIERYDHGERSLRVIGKGNKERTAYLHQGAVPYLDRWLVTVGARRGAMFRGVDRWGHIGAKPLSARSIGYILNERREQAGVPRLSTHDFRRTFIGDFIDAGGDLVQAQKLAGHASATTTASYDRRPGRALRAAVDKLSLPSPDQLTPKREA